MKKLNSNDSLSSALHLQDITLLQHIRKSDHKTSVYFVKTAAELNWSYSESNICDLPSNTRESESSPTLLKQLVELEFFSDVGGMSSQRPPSDLEHTLGNTLVPAVFEQPSVSLDCTMEANTVVFSDSRLVDSCNATNDNNSSEIYQTAAAGEMIEIVQLCKKTELPSSGGDRGQSVDACGILQTNVDCGNDADTDRPTSTLSARLSFERSCSDVDSETYPLIAESELVDGLTDGFCSGLASFTGTVLQSCLLSTVALINAVHHRCLETMISVAFDMAWDVICTPTRIKFARTKEVVNCISAFDL